MLRRTIKGLAVTAFALASTAAIAQYKWQTPDGGIVYSDLPPPSGVRLITDRNGRSAAPEDEVQLPFTLKNAMGKYPVVLYTAPECAPCNSARDLLVARGIPFSEKTVGTGADFDAFKRIGFVDGSFPAISVGAEKMSGFEPTGLGRMLDNAGYPKGSMLPSRYKRAEAQPLTPPPTQKLVVRSDAAATEGGNGQPQAAQQAAIDRYRDAMRAGAQQRAPVPQEPSIRF
ncbi:MAG: DUF4124 domain-containing protein [Lautropia sp.]